jgi:hypothetical protein
MKKVTVLFALVSMLLSFTALAQASPIQIFAFGDGYTASYNASQGANTWNAEIQFTGTTTLQGDLWMQMEKGNWAGDGTNVSMDVRTTPTALYEYDPTQVSINPPYSVPLFQKLKLNQSWSYKDTNGNSVTATIVSIGSLKVPAGTYNNVYGVHYVSTVQDEMIYWAPGVGLIQDIDSSNPSSPITRSLSSHPIAEILVGTWTGNMTIVTSSTSAVETGTVQVIFDQVGNTTQAYTGSLTWTPANGSAGSSFTLPLTVIRGPFDPTLLHISSVGHVILGEMRKPADVWVVDLHGTDVSSGNTYVSLGLNKE